MTQKSSEPWLVFDHVPQGCRLHLVRNDACAPALQPGEFAIIDHRVMEPVDGALYLVQWRPGGSREMRARKITDENRGQLCDRDMKRLPDEYCAYLNPLKKFRFGPDGRPLPNQGPGIYFSEGPIRMDRLPEFLLGRVIGVYCAPGAGRPAVPARKSLR